MSLLAGLLWSIYTCTCFSSKHDVIAFTSLLPKPSSLLMLVPVLIQVYKLRQYLHVQCPVLC